MMIPPGTPPTPGKALHPTRHPAHPREGARHPAHPEAAKARHACRIVRRHPERIVLRRGVLLEQREAVGAAHGMMMHVVATGWTGRGGMGGNRRALAPARRAVVHPMGGTWGEKKVVHPMGGTWGAVVHPNGGGASITTKITLCESDSNVIIDVSVVQLFRHNRPEGGSAKKKGQGLRRASHCTESFP